VLYFVEVPTLEIGSESPALSYPGKRVRVILNVIDSSPTHTGFREHLMLRFRWRSAPVHLV
jgi:hypothetical protein